MTPIEKELGKLVKELEPAPLREGFQDELRSTLQQAIEKKAGEEQQKPAEQKMDPAQAGPDGTGASQAKRRLFLAQLAQEWPGA